MDSVGVRLSAPVIERALCGQVTLASYRAFLHEAYHHVRHTVPLLRACRARLPERLAWMHPALDEYIAEEQGHDRWILDDVAACGGDPSAVRNGIPSAATELMVAYAYDTIARRNPDAFFGMVLVLEGTSVALALHAADRHHAAESEEASHGRLAGDDLRRDVEEHEVLAEGTQRERRGDCDADDDHAHREHALATRRHVRFPAARRRRSSSARMVARRRRAAKTFATMTSAVMP